MFQLWANSNYYRTSSKLIVLLKQIGNLIIQQAKRFLDPSSIFHSDIDEAMQRISQTIKVKSCRQAQFTSSRHLFVLVIYFS